MIIAIDGTSGSGKSSAAELFSERQSLTLLNTGSLYRVITQECLEREIDIEQTNAVINIASKCDFNHVNLQDLYTEDISKTVPIIARIPEVRSIVRTFQVESSKKDNIVIEGRDIGSVVFPKAEIKFFITASPDDAIIIDSSIMTLESVVERLEEEYKKRKLAVKMADLKI